MIAAAHKILLRKLCIEAAIPQGNFVMFNMKFVLVTNILGVQIDPMHSNK